jgi:tetratricopeptide (TPR) repeat protein
MIRTPFRFVVIFSLLSGTLVAQTPSVQLTIMESSGFLGMGGPKVASVQLSTQKGDSVLNSENVNDGQYIYFHIKPVGDWALDADILREHLSQLQIYQDEQSYPIVWKGNILVGPPTSIVVGYAKEIKLNRLFLFQIKVGEKTSQAEMSVPREYWPGYGYTIGKAREMADAMNAGEVLRAIGVAEQVIPQTDLSIFPQYNQLKAVRTTAFRMHLDGIHDEFESVINGPTDLKSKMTEVESFAPRFQFVIDSLPRAEWSIGSLDQDVYPIVEKARRGIERIGFVNDSLLQVLEELNTRWILEGATTGKDGFKYQYMIETLAYAFSSMDFSDTTATALDLTVSEEFLERLERYQIFESYETFIKMCEQRFKAGLPMFPVEFLPNLRKDTASFIQPYYSMLKAVNDYHYGLFNTALDEVSYILVRCTESDLNAKYDHIRVLIRIRLGDAPSEVLRVLDEAEQFEEAGNDQEALQRYRQATILAPNFAYGFYSLGQYYARSGDPIRAINFFQRAYEIDTLYVSAYREAYNMYLRQGNYKPMITVLTFALDHGNDTWEINSNLGTAHLGDNDPGKAIQFFERALQLNGKSYTTNIQLGLSYQTIKDYQRAREYFNNAIGLDPTRQEAVDYLQRLNEVQRSDR